MGGVLEYGELRRLLGYHRHGLNAGRPGADQPDPQPVQVHRLMRPLAGVVDGAAERLHVGEVRRAGGGQAARRHDAERRLRHVAPVRLDHPQRPVFVERRGRDTRLELDVLAQPKPVGDVVGVGQDLQLGCEPLGPVPILLQRV